MGASSDGREIVAEAFKLAIIELTGSADPDKNLNPNVGRCVMAVIVELTNPGQSDPIGLARYAVTFRREKSGNKTSFLV